MFFAVAEATPQDLPKASPRADRARGRKGERKKYCMYTAIYTYHHISATDLLMPASARRASTRGFVDLQTNCTSRRRAKEKVVRASERKRLLSK